ncbi:phosphoglucomutase/phosphomannomutase family protein [bacterium]|nr:phosphoglucomutase/phosphomannomutase family protein [bacterium]
MNPIQFGTDGWRAIIAEDFTFANVARVAGALAAYYRQAGETRPIVVGYDRRFASEEFGRRVARVLAGAGLPVLFCTSYAPTPAISLLLVKEKAGGAVVITASHNPAEYNGVKIKGDFGGPVTPELTAEVEKILRAQMEAGEEPALCDYAEAVAKKKIVEVDAVPGYQAAIESFVNVEAIRRAGLRVVVDALYGAGSRVLAGVLEKWGMDVTEFHAEYNPGFGGLHPEPIAPNLEFLGKKVKELNADVGLATDGDADRIGIVDENGAFIGTQAAFALLFMHLVEDRRMSGAVAKACSSTSMLDKLARKYNLPVYETRVGFKWVCDLMIDPGKNVLLGGEESGGYGLRGHVPERDAGLVALLFLEMMAQRRASVTQLLRQLYEKVGPHAFLRIDVRTTEERKQSALRKLANYPPKAFAGVKVERVDTKDGYKLYLANGGWVLVRPSGTEPLLRTYCEAPSDAACKEILAAVHKALLAVFGRRRGGR